LQAADLKKWRNLKNQTREWAERRLPARRVHRTKPIRAGLKAGALLKSGFL
jgi:hypothetical protein